MLWRADPSHAWMLGCVCISLCCLLPTRHSQSRRGEPISVPLGKKCTTSQWVPVLHASLLQLSSLHKVAIKASCLSAIPAGDRSARVVYYGHCSTEGEEAWRSAERASDFPTCPCFWVLLRLLTWPSRLGTLRGLGSGDWRSRERHGTCTRNHEFTHWNLPSQVRY